MWGSWDLDACTYPALDHCAADNRRRVGQSLPGEPSTGLAGDLCCLVFSPSIVCSSVHWCLDGGLRCLVQPIKHNTNRLVVNPSFAPMLRRFLDVMRCDRCCPSWISPNVRDGGGALSRPLAGGAANRPTPSRPSF